ncbi:MAG: 50S ribosomal protein L18a [Candidatus Diapherotrites archaeon]|nr:50S ribosomal protein L18a [Candidatus Diapherotrites archaeon]
MIKIYRLKGIFGEKGAKHGFAIDVRALKPEDAKEKVYTDIGSKHKCKRREVQITSVEEVPAGETTSLLVKQLSEGE